MSDTVLITDIQDNEPVGFHPDMGAVRQMLQNAQDSKVCCLEVVPCLVENARYRSHSSARTPADIVSWHQRRKINYLHQGLCIDIFI